MIEVPRRRRTIIVTDDDEGERYLIQKAMEDSGVQDAVHFIENGEMLIERPTGQLAGAGPGAPNLPCLILLDLNMPGMDGREVLKVIKSHPELREIPVVVMSNSRNPADIENTYRNGANSFFTKPLDYSGLVGLVPLLKTYWLETAMLPSGAA